MNIYLKMSHIHNSKRDLPKPKFFSFFSPSISKKCIILSPFFGGKQLTWVKQNLGH